MQVDYKKQNTFKVLLIVGIALMIASAFLPIVTVGTADDESTGAGLSYFNMTTGSFLNPYEENLGPEEEGAKEAVKTLRVLTLMVFWLPLIVMVVTAIVIARGKKLKFFSGLAVGNLIYSSVLLFVAIRGAKLYLKREAEDYGMNIDDVFHTSMLTILLFIAGLIVCTVAAILSARNASSDGGEAGAGKLLLVCTEGHMTVDHVELPLDKPITVGRNAAMSAVVFDDGKVSKQHATLEYDMTDGMMYITDMSTYGTSLADGTKLVKGVKTPVGSDTEIVLSQKSRFVIRY